jgi:hypothetical protein
MTFAHRMLEAGRRLGYVAPATEPTTGSRQTAFNILKRHGDCFADDVSLNDLLDDIAAAIDAARAGPTIP